MVYNLAKTGAQIDAIHTKVDGIETGAEVNPTAAETKTAYESNADTNAYDDAAVSKLAGIEANATADQSDAEIETAYNNQVAEVSQVQAEAGTSTTVLRWTPQRVSQAIAALASGGASSLSELSDVDSSVSSPSDGDILVYRSAGSDWVLEAKPAAGSNPAAADITDATADGIALITSADANPFTDADEAKLDGIEASADVTDTANVTAAGALMDSEVTNLAQVKAFDSSDYATAAQGSTADSAMQNLVDDTTPQLGGALDAQNNSVTNIDDIEVQGHSYADGEVDDGNSSTADTIDWTSGQFHKSTMTGNCTYTFTAPTGPTTLVLKIIQDATGSRLATWPAAVEWSGGTAPTLTTTANAVDIITFYYDGTNYFGFHAGDFS